MTFQPFNSLQTAPDDNEKTCKKARINTSDETETDQLRSEETEEEDNADDLFEVCDKLNPAQNLLLHETNH